MSQLGGSLETRGITVRFGGLAALEDVSLTFDPGRIHGVIGPNGAGKTTLLNVLSGLQDATSGTIRADDVDITSWSPRRVVTRARITRTFQTVRLFTSMSVRENVWTAARCANRRRETAAVVDELLTRLALDDVRDALAATLSYGVQRRVELARALASRPRVLLLDEPAAGLSPPEREALAEVLRSISARGTTVILVEHHMDLVHAVCEHCAVIDFGKVVSSGPTAEVLEDPRVLDAYLGRNHAMPATE